MNIVNIIAGPVIGSVIGYFTNFLAIKMLFRPLKPVKIGSFTLPFTPGIIPKRKNQLAKALGVAIGSKLVTNDDLEKIFMSNEIKDNIINKVLNVLNSDKSLKEYLLGYFSEEDYSVEKNNFGDMLCRKIISTAEKMNIGDIIAIEGLNAVKSKIQENVMLALFANDKLLDSFAEPIANHVNQYVSEHGYEKLLPFIRDEITKSEEKSIAHIFANFELTNYKISDILSDVYQNLVSKNINDIMHQVDIATIVENKVNEMDIKDIEDLVLSVMKNELNSIVNLGALIGFLIGLINIFI